MPEPQRMTFEMACCDDVLGGMVPSDLRQIVVDRDRAEATVGRLREPRCQLAGPGRGDCEHAVGLPGIEQEVDHDGPRTQDCYGKPNGWCWWCWHAFKLEAAEARYTRQAEEE